MARTHNRSRKKWMLPVLAIILFLFFFPGVSGVSGASGQAGFLVINNYSNYFVTIMTQTVNYYGYTTWKPVAQVAPRSQIRIPNVPAGAVFGASAGSVWWPAFPVIYTYGNPVFTYNIYP